MVSHIPFFNKINAAAAEETALHTVSEFSADDIDVMVPNTLCTLFEGDKAN